jgi:hypothetical protein
VAGCCIIVNSVFTSGIASYASQLLSLLVQAARWLIRSDCLMEKIMTMSIPRRFCFVVYYCLLACCWWMHHQNKQHHNVGERLSGNTSHEPRSSAPVCV